MKGIKHIEVSNRDVKYKFDLVRNITIVRGNSGTGKSILYSMIAEYMRDGEKSGVNLSSPCPCIALDDLLWKERISGTSGSIVFIDEDGAKFLRTKEFASAVKLSDNYYVIITREDLHELPYSVDEIYKIKTSGKKYHTLEKLYAEQLKTRCFPGKIKLPKIDTVITEDSKSGFMFFENAFSKKGAKTVPACSKSKIYESIKTKTAENIFVIADGAAFGPEIDKVNKLISIRKNIVLFLPESFEWLILKSGLIDNVTHILESPSEYIESRDYFSWERYFTKLLEKETAGTYLVYRKDRLNPKYLNEKETNAIIEVLPKTIPK